MRRLLVCAVVLASGSSLACAPQNSPEDVARQYADAIRREDYAAAARLTHPRALQQLRDLFAPFMSTAAAGELGPALFGVTTRAEYDQLADTTLFAAFIKNTLQQQPEQVVAAMRTAKMTVIGHVKGGRDSVFVVTRIEMTMEDLTISSFEVTPFSKHEGRWLGLLKADIGNMAAMLRRAASRAGSP